MGPACRPKELLGVPRGCGTFAQGSQLIEKGTAVNLDSTAYFYFVVRLHFNLMRIAWPLAFDKRIPWLGGAVDAGR